MSKTSHPIRDAVVGTVIAGLILGLLGKIWPAAASLFTATLAVPVWVAALAIAAVILAARAFFIHGGTSVEPRRLAAGSAKAPAADDGTETSGTIVELQDHVLARVAKEEGSIEWGKLRRSLSLTQIRLQAAVDSLEHEDLLEVLQPVDAYDADENIVRLTSAGVRSVVERGLA